MISSLPYGLALLLSLLITCPAAADCLFYRSDGSCAPGHPESAVASSSNPLMNIILPNKKKPLLKDDLYLVDISCQRNMADKADTKWGLFAKTNVATSHIIALTPTRLSQATFPTQAKALVTVFAVSGNDADKNVYINENCRTKFVISGRDPVFLAATANRTETNEPTAFTKSIYALVQVALKILPLFQGSVFDDVYKPKLEQYADTQKPVTELLSTLNNGATRTVPADIYQGETIILTAYSKVRVKVDKIKTIIGTNIDELIVSYEDSFKSHIEELKTASSTDDIEKKCGQEGANLINKNLAAADVAYGLSYSTRLAQLSPNRTLACLGREYSLLALQFETLWSKYPNPINKESIGAYFIEAKPWPAQPEFEKAKLNLRASVRALGSYAQQLPNVPVSAKINFAHYFAEKIEVRNLSDLFEAEDLTLTREELVNKFYENKISKFGCLTSDNAAVAMLLAIGEPEDGAKKYSKEDTFVLRVWLDGKQKIGRILIDYDIDSSVKAIIANSNTCGKKVAFAP